MVFKCCITNKMLFKEQLVHTLILYPNLSKIINDLEYNFLSCFGNEPLCPSIMYTILGHCKTLQIWFWRRAFVCVCVFVCVLWRWRRVVLGYLIGKTTGESFVRITAIGIYYTNLCADTLTTSLANFDLYFHLYI